MTDDFPPKPESPSEETRPHADYDDEPESDEERALVAEARADMERGATVPHEVLRQRLGLSAFEADAVTDGTQLPSDAPCPEPLPTGSPNCPDWREALEPPPPPLPKKKAKRRSQRQHAARRRQQMKELRRVVQRWIGLLADKHKPVTWTRIPLEWHKLEKAHAWFKTLPIALATDIVEQRRLVTLGEVLPYMDSLRLSFMIRDFAKVFPTRRRFKHTARYNNGEKRRIRRLGPLFHILALPMVLSAAWAWPYLLQKAALAGFLRARGLSLSIWDMSMTDIYAGYAGECPETDAMRALYRAYSASGIVAGMGPSNAYLAVNLACSNVGESPRADALRQLLLCGPHHAVDRAAVADVGKNAELDEMRSFRIFCRGLG